MQTAAAGASIVVVKSSPKRNLTPPSPPHHRKTMSVDDKPTPQHAMLENLLRIGDMVFCMGTLFGPDEQDELAQTGVPVVTQHDRGTIFGTTDPETPLQTRAPPTRLPQPPYHVVTLPKHQHHLPTHANLATTVP